MMFSFYVGSPDDHAKHPLDVGQGEVSKPTGLLVLLLQRLHEEVERVNGVPVLLLALGNGMCLTALHLKIATVWLDEFG